MTGMKSLLSLLCLILALLLTGTLFLTRPSQKSFEDFYADQASSGQKGLLGQIFGDAAAREYAKTFTYTDRVLWVTVSKDGKTAFTGVAGHWVPRDLSVAKPGFVK